MPWAPDYATEADFKSLRRVSENIHDDEIAMALSASSRVVDKATDRQFGKTDTIEQRTCRAEWSDTHGRYMARIEDVMTTAGLVVTVSGTALDAADYTLWPLDEDKRGRPWRRILVDSITPPARGTGPGTILVDATWGWTSVPVTVKQATLLQASKFFEARNAPHGVIAESDLRLLERAHPEVALMLQTFRRDWPRL